MIIDNNYDYQEWYLHDLTQTQKAQETRLSQKALEKYNMPEKTARTDVVDFGADAKSAIESRNANGVSAASESEENNLAQSSDLSDNTLAKGTGVIESDSGTERKNAKPELKLKLHTANIDRFEKNEKEYTERASADTHADTVETKSHVTAAQQKNISVYQQQQRYTDSLVMSQNLAAHL